MPNENKSRRKLLQTMLAAGGATVLAGCGGDGTPTEPTVTTEPDTDTPTEQSSPEQTDSPTPEQSAGNVEETTAELEQYQDPIAAWEDGWENSMEYIANEDGSAAIGVPFTNPDVAEDEVDPMRPHALLYRLTGEGQYELVGAQWTVPADAVEEAPSLFGETFSGPQQGLGARQGQQFALRAWLFTENPEGQFATFNPELSPPEFARQYTDVGYAIRPFANLTTARQAGYAARGNCRSGPDGSEGVNYLSQEDPFNTAGMVYHSYFQSLLYEETDDGQQLVGVKWILPVEEVESQPSLVGQEMRGPMEGYFEGMPEHYELTLWRKPNPNGLFARWNPTIEC